MQLVAAYSPVYEFREGTGWADTGERELQWTVASATLNYSTGDYHAWHNRLRLSAFTNTTLAFDLARYTNSNLSLRYGARIWVYRFFDFEVSAVSRNQLVYQYIGTWADAVGRPKRDLIPDLIDSLRLFDREARERTHFNLQEIRVRAVHDLQDWELSATYSGAPELVGSGASRRYEWNGVLSLLVRWRPISELRRNIIIDDGAVDFGE